MNILQQIRSRGLFFSFGVLFNRVVPATVFRCRVFRVYQLSADAPPTRPTALSLEVIKCELPIEAELAREVTRTGHGSWNSPAIACWLCRDDDQAIGGVWIGHDFFCESDLGVTVVLGQQQCWLFSAYVEKQHRGCGVYQCLLGEVLKQCQPKTVFCAINPTNRASLAAHDPWIQRSLGTFVAFRLLGVAICLNHGVIRPRRLLSRHCRTAPIEIDLTLLS